MAAAPLLSLVSVSHCEIGGFVEGTGQPVGQTWAATWFCMAREQNGFTIF